MAWFLLIVASFGEIFAMASINLYLQKRTFFRLFMIGFCFGFGFFFLWWAMRTIQMGLAYAVWAGLGAAGSVLVGIVFFKEGADWKRIVFLSCIIVGAAGLNLVS